MRIAVFNDTREARHYGCDLVMLELWRRLERHGLTPVWASKVGEDWRSREDLPVRGDVNAVVVNGEGTIHHTLDRPGAVWLAEVAAFARDSLGVPSFLVNATTDAIDSDTAAKIAEFDVVSVRENRSRAELARHGIDAVVVPDLTTIAHLPFGGDREGVAGTDSQLVDVKEVLRLRSEAEAWPFRSPKWRTRKNRDLQYTDAARLEGVHEFCRYLSAHRLVVTGRFHVVTMCVATRTPFVAIESNTFKISSFVEDVFGDTRRVVGAERMAEGDLSVYAEWDGAEEEAIERFLRSARARAETLYAGIAERVVRASSSDVAADGHSG